jgi:hypothetical protein
MDYLGSTMLKGVKQKCVPVIEEIREILFQAAYRLLMQQGFEILIDN